MCSTCMAAAAATATRVVSLGGLTAYGVRTLLFKPLPQSEPEPELVVEGKGEATEDSIDG